MYVSLSVVIASTYMSGTLLISRIVIPSGKTTTLRGSTILFCFYCAATHFKSPCSAE